jgi:predicted secreted protein
VCPDDWTDPPVAAGRDTEMANSSTPYEQGQPGAPLTPHESEVLNDIGKRLFREDPALGSMLGAVQPAPRRWHGLGTVLTCVVLATLAVCIGVWLGGVAFSLAMSVTAVATVLGCVGVGAVECLWLVISDGHRPS